MATVDKIQVKRGLKSKLSISSLDDGEICFIEDDNVDGGAIYIGNSKGSYERIPTKFDIDDLRNDIMNIIGDANNLITVNKIIVDAINELTQSGFGVGGGTVNYTNYTYTASSDNTSTFDIVDNGIYDPATDYIQLYLKGVMLQPTVDYTISDLHVTLNTFTLNNGEDIYMLIFKTLPINGTNLVDGTVEKQKFEASVQATLTNADKIGDLPSLLTTIKTSIVNAINEIVNNMVKTSDIVTTATANKILKLNSNSKLPASITGDSATVGGLTVIQLSPPGKVEGFLRETPPDGYLEMNNQWVSQTTYANLYTVIYPKIVDEANHPGMFQIIDAETENRFFRAAGNGLDVGTVQEDMFKSHTHTQNGSAGPSGSGWTWAGAGTTTTGNTGSTGGTETRPKNIALLYCIKY